MVLIVSVTKMVNEEKTQFFHSNKSQPNKNTM